MNSEIEIRDFVKDDESYIFSTWLKHYRFSSWFPKRIPKSIYFKEHHHLVSKHLKDRGVTIKIATPTGSPEVIVGYFVYEKLDVPVIHFLYVKKVFRKLGVAKALLDGFEIGNAVFSHWTEDTDWILNRFPNMKYDPYCFLRRK